MSQQQQQLLLPDDIIFEILLCLGVKTLLSRIQYVSKSWKAIITDPLFQKAHRCFRAKQNPPLNINIVTTTVIEDEDRRRTILQLQTRDRRSGNPIDDLETRRLPPNKPWRVITCRDLVCILSYDMAIFWNPATGESFELPLLNPGAGYNYWAPVGFGYVPSTEEFKMLHIFDEDQNTFNLCCEIFTLCVDHQWRAAPPIPSSVDDGFDRHGIRGEVNASTFVNGSVHFMPYQLENVGIAAFNLEREEWSMIPSPPVTFPQYIRLSIHSLGGLLCAMESPDWESEHYCIWLLKEENCWVKEYDIDLSVFSNGDLFPYMIPLAIEQDGRILIQASRPDSRWLYYYDPKGKNHEPIIIVPPQGGDSWFTTNLYVDGFTSCH